MVKPNRAPTRRIPPKSGRKEWSMLDVHAPHETVHTWRDFFIHIATIVVGLVIAVGLEQTVEAVHHARQRRALVSEMRVEARRNVELLHTDIDRNLDKAHWNFAVMTVLQTARPVDGFVVVTLPRHEEFLPQIYPSRATWSIAKTNGTASLLPENQAKIYDRLDSEAENELAAEERVNVASLNLQADEVRIGIDMQPGATVRLPAGEVPVLADDIARRIAALQDDASWNALWAGAANGVAHDVRDRDDFVRYFRQERIALFKRMPAHQ